MSNKVLKNNELSFEKSGQFDLNFLSEFAHTINVSDNILLDLDVRQFSDKKVTINVGKNSVCNVRLFIDNGEKTFNLQAFCSDYAVFNLYFADFSKDNSLVNIETNLKGLESKADIKYSVISSDLNLKKYNILINHLNDKTNSNFEGYGVATKNSEIYSNCVTHIFEKCIKSEAHQISKIILFDEQSKAHADPILRIDCDDVVASHGVAIGALNESHIFYLKSRGLTDEEARRLIVIGYLLPIKNYFGEEDASKIANHIGGDFNV